MSNEDEKEDRYRIKLKTVSAFKWKGKTRDPHDIPMWAKRLSRGAKLNEADPPGLIIDTLSNGYVNVPDGSWFVHHTVANIVLVRTEEEFQQLYEPNA